MSAQTSTVAAAGAAAGGVAGGEGGVEGAVEGAVEGVVEGVVEGAVAGAVLSHAKHPRTVTRQQRLREMFFMVETRAPAPWGGQGLPAGVEDPQTG